MKKNLFTKFLALFLAGTMLAGVGCKSYDDDIDDINKRLDGMDVTIASLPEQLQNIKNMIPNLSDLNQKVSALEGKVNGIGDVKAQLATLETTLKQYTDNKVNTATSAEALKAALGNYYATTSKLNEVETKLTDITKEGGVIDDSILAAINELKTNASSWMGPQMVQYLSGQGYADKNTTITEATSKIEGEILNKMKNEQDAYYKAIEAVVGKATITKLGAAVVKSENLDPALKSLIEKIEPLIDRVNELEGRIQSLVFVPRNTNEAMYNFIEIAGAPYIQVIGSNNEPALHTLVAKNKPEIEINYRVSPASLAEKMTEKTVSFLFDKIDTRAIENPSFTVKEVKNKDKATGKFTVVAETDYELGIEDKTLAVALNVKIAPKEGSESTQGIDYNSAYVSLFPIGNQRINDDLVIALNPNDKEKAVFLAEGDTYATELKYDDSAKQEFFKDFTVYYKSGSKYVQADQIWDGISIDIKKPAAADKATVSDASHKDNYTLTNLDAVISKKDVKLIGDEITSKNFAYAVKFTSAGTVMGSAPVGTVNQKIKVVGSNATFATEKAATLNWNYTIATTSNFYRSASVKLNAGLKGEIYNAMKSMKPAITLKKGSAAVTSINAMLELVSNPDNESTTDTENINILLLGDLKESADYSIKAVYTLADKTFITINADVKVEGIPALSEQTITKTVDYKAATKSYLVKENFAEGLWNEAWKGKFFTDKAEFEAVVYAMTGTATKRTGNKATLAKNVKNIDVVFDNDAKGSTVYTPSILFKDANTDLSVNFKSNVQIALPAAVLTDNMSLGTDGKAKANAAINGSSYTISGFNLLQAYSYTGTVTGTQTVFTISDTNIAKKANIANNELNWGTYNGLEIPIKAELKIDGYVLDTKTFKVYITDPIKDAAIAAKAGTLEASISKSNEIMIASLVTLNADIAKDANVFDTKGTDGLSADLKAALSGGAKYTLVTDNVDLAAKNLTFDAKSGKLTVGQFESLAPVQEISLQFKVVYTYRFGERSNFVTITVKPESAKPAEK